MTASDAKRPIAHYRLWARRPGRKRWELKAVGTSEEILVEQAKLLDAGYCDFYPTDRTDIDPNVKSRATA